MAHPWNLPFDRDKNSAYGELGVGGGGVARVWVAGAWALVGQQADIDKAKTDGLQTSGAVVAASTLESVDAVNASGTKGRGVYAHSILLEGVVGESDQNIGVTAVTHNKLIPALLAQNAAGRAARFEGNVEVTGDLSANKLMAAQDIILSGGDCAEEFDLALDQIGEPGTVMVIDDEQRLIACEQAYDARVTGVIAGAGEYRPGLILDRRPSPNRRCAIALLGKVYCKVDASFGAIRVGDLLTTSSNRGHAMKASDRLSAFGATIGKALSAWPEGIGLIPVLVSTR